MILMLYTDMVMAANIIGNEGARAFANALLTNTTLFKLDLYGASINHAYLMNL